MTSRTLFADNAVPRALQLIAAKRSFETSSRTHSLLALSKVKLQDPVMWLAVCPADCC